MSSLDKIMIALTGEQNEARNSDDRNKSLQMIGSITNALAFLIATTGRDDADAANLIEAAEIKLTDEIALLRSGDR